MMVTSLANQLMNERGHERRAGILGAVSPQRKAFRAKAARGLAVKNATCSPIRPDRFGRKPFRARSPIAMVAQWPMRRMAISRV